MDTDQFDYVIVGGGTAGCLLANRLSADPAKRVCLLEAGGEDNWIWINIPVGYLYCIANPRTDWMFRTTKDPGLNGRDIHYARGRGLGGCSLINAMIYMRGQKRDYDHWASVTGDSGWDWESVLPHFLKHEDSHRGDSHFHRSGGEVRIEEQRLSWKILDRFAQAAEQAGIPRTPDFNTGNNAGSGRFEVTQKTGVRWHAGKAFINPVRKRPNLVIRSHSQAQRLLFEGSRCVGVEVRSTGGNGPGTWVARARSEVVLAAGSIGSPQLLQRSGVGSPDLLGQHGIAVTHALPGVGENLQDHLQLRMAFKVRGIKTLNTMANSLWGKAMMGLEYAFMRSGPLTMAPSQLGVFWQSSNEHATPNLQYHVQPLSLDKFGDPLHPFPAFTASVCNLRPSSRGHVRITSTDPDAKPEINCNYLSTDEDRKVASAALKLTRHIVGMPALRNYAPEEFLPGPKVQTDEELARAAGDIGTTIFHPVGTCRMGKAGDPLAVVDPQLRVVGLQGLRVADASVMPTITSGNTNAPTLMIAERAAAMMLAGMTTVDKALRVSVGTLSLKNPVICASGEHVMTEAGIRAALNAGAAVVVAKSINESQAARDQLGQTDYLRTDPFWEPLPWHGQGGSILCRSGLQPRACADWIFAVAALDREAAAHDAYVAGSIILAGLDAAVALARDYEAAGIRLLEFNVGTPYGDEASHGGVTTERAATRIREQVKAVTSAVRIPVWVKLTGQSENVAALATAAREGGAAAVTMIGRMLGMLPDLETMAPALDTNLGYGGPWALPLTCYWLARSRRSLGNDYPLIGTNGARSGHDVARMLLAGASAVEMCSAVMTGGFGVLGAAVDQLAAYLGDHDVAANAIVGRAADRVKGFADLPARGEVWREFVPPATLAG